MINNSKVLAIVPARSGSKGLPNKNIKELYHSKNYVLIKVIIKVLFIFMYTPRIEAILPIFISF